MRRYNFLYREPSRYGMYLCMIISLYGMLMNDDWYCWLMLDAWCLRCLSLVCCVFWRFVRPSLDSIIASSINPDLTWYRRTRIYDVTTREHERFKIVSIVTFIVVLVTVSWSTYDSHYKRSNKQHLCHTPIGITRVHAPLKGNKRKDLSAYVFTFGEVLSLIY